MIIISCNTSVVIIIDFSFEETNIKQIFEYIVYI